MATSDYYKFLTYNTNSPFAGAILKAKRAQRHLVELAEAARVLPFKRGQNFAIGPDPDAGQVKIIYMPSRMALEFSAVVGDAAHNIRCAFDHLAVALTAPPIGTGKANDTYFPTGVTRDEFIRARDGHKSAKGKWIKGKMEGAPADALLMVEELEPYAGGKHSLRALHDLDILDKHKLLVLSDADMTVLKLDVVSDDRRVTLRGSDFQSEADGTDFVARISWPGIERKSQVSLDGDFHASFDVVFGKGQPFEGQAVVPTLTKLANLAEGFAKVCEGRFYR